MQNQTQVDEMFEKFKEHCRDSTQYNLKTFDEIITEFNRWRRNQGCSQIEEDDSTPDIPSEELLKDLVPESVDADLDEEDGWVKL